MRGKWPEMLSRENIVLRLDVMTYRSCMGDHNICTWMMFSRSVFCDCGKSISGHSHIASLVEGCKQITEVVSACVDRVAYVLLTSSGPKSQKFSLQSLQDFLRKRLSYQ